MNILVVCHFGLYQNLSFSFVHNQVREYAALGHKVRVIIPNGWGKSDREGARFGKALRISSADGVELYDLRYFTLSRYGEKGFNTKSAIHAIRTHWNKVLEDFQPQVIHAHTFGFDSCIGAWLKRKLHCPLVVTTHGSDTEIPLSSGQVHLLCEDANNADEIVAVSSKLKNRVISCGTVTPIRTIINGFVSHKSTDSFVRDPFRMIQVNNLVPSKKTDVTLHAFAELKKQYPQMSYVIVGAGSELGTLKELSSELGISDSVTFRGVMDNEKVFEELCKSSFFVMVSKPEGFGIAYLEAMAAGCITIGTEGEGIADVIVHKENGFLVPADNPTEIINVIEWCINHPEQAIAIAEKGRLCARELTWQKNAKHYLDVFEDLINESKQ